LALQALGGTWVKLGQVLALRFDLLPPDYCYELFKLLNQVRPFDYREVRQIVFEDLGDYPERLYRSFEDTPFAAASIGQVHRATLLSGETVAVKVQRPKIRKTIRRDLRLMYRVASLVDFTHLLGGVRLRLVIDEFARWTNEELDYQVEGRNAYTLRETSDGDPLEHDPNVYFDLTSERVLTMEMITGIPLIDVMYGIREDRDTYTRQFGENGYDVQAVATHLAWNVLNQVYQQGYFHADLHPANLFVLPGNAIGYVDFGIVGVMPNEVRESLVHYAWNLYQGEVDRATEEFMRWIQPTEQTNLAAARADIIRVLDNYLFALRAAEKPGFALPGGSDFEVDLLNAIRSNGMTVEPSVVTYFKALITANAVIFELDPTFDLLGIENKFFGKMILQEAQRLGDPREAVGTAFDYGYRLVRAMGALDALRETEQEADVYLLRLRRRLQILAVLAVGAGVGLYALYVRHTHTSPSWVAVALIVGIVVLGVAMIGYGRGLTQPSRSSKRNLPKRRAVRRTGRQRRANVTPR
jgi:predicted unusual protein kinase regulating ubiquinone biosynthesis (AarF/ABC1/UbiB family)